MLTRSTRIAQESLRRLHPRAIESASEIRALLEHAVAQESEFSRGLNYRIDLERAHAVRVTDDLLTLRVINFERVSNAQVFLSFRVDGQGYFFATSAAGPLVEDRLDVHMPHAIYFAERRDRHRRSPDPVAGDTHHVVVAEAAGRQRRGHVADYSPGGIGIVVEGSEPVSTKGSLRVRYLDGRDAGVERELSVCNQAPARSPAGWTRLGLAPSPTGDSPPIAVEFRESILPDGVRVREAGTGDADGGTGDRRPKLDIRRFENDRGEEIVALVDSWGDTRGATTVIIPPGWGQTKEALLGLARTIVATFRSAGEPVVVLRFDGIRRRGESYNDPECRAPGRENHHFTFSQGVYDIEATLDYLEKAPEFQPEKVVLVTFSAAAIEGRKALARDSEKRISGWVCVVGSPDVQSMTRSISGGVDYAAGYERGMHFGFQELLGVVVDIDRIGVDSDAMELIFIEDSRRDLEQIDVPITWFHGQYDAWMDLDRVRDVLSHGDSNNRKLIAIPTGHIVRSSQQAIATFQCVAMEIGRMSLGRELEPEQPKLRDLALRRAAERRRRPAAKLELRDFWRDYLVGRDQSVGIELLTWTSAFQEMMALQVGGLVQVGARRILDLGSGTGAFALSLAELGEARGELEVVEVDFVREALQRARQRLAATPSSGLSLRFLECDLNLCHEAQRLPITSQSFDGVLASLVLSYLENPGRVLDEIHRVLRPGGRLVLSSLCLDADLSKLYAESLAELRAGAALEHLPEVRVEDLDRVARDFLNDASRILDLEEAGAFRFWDSDELSTLVREHGFRVVEVARSLGHPPQAAVLIAERI